MKGLELSRSYYEEFGRDMIKDLFPELEGFIACGLVGEGSECFGFDDEISTDHDFEPGFCLFIPDGEDKVDSRTEFRLERAYASLPKEYRGYKRQRLSPVGGNRRGVIRIGDFYKKFTGRPDGLKTLGDWLGIEEHFLASATNGEIFRDDSGVFSAIRRSIAYYPSDVFKKKLAGSLLMMAQAGQYNYTRCIKHGETGAAQLAANLFVTHAMHAVFLLNRRYMPYYKWSFRALRGLEKFPQFAETFEYLLTTDNGAENAETKGFVIEDIAGMIIGELQEQGLTGAVCGDLEKHAYSVNDGIADPGLRNEHILLTVKSAV